MSRTARFAVAALVIIAVALVVVWAVSSRRPESPTGSGTPAPSSQISTIPTGATGQTPGAQPSGSQPSGSQPSASTTRPYNLPAPPQPTAPVHENTSRTVVYKVHATGPATVTYGAIGDRPTTVDITADWTTRVTVTQPDATVRVKVTGGSGSAVSCEILIDDVSASTRAGIGTPATATCAANVQMAG